MIKKLPIILMVLILVTVWAFFSFLWEAKSPPGVGLLIVNNDLSGTLTPKGQSDSLARALPENDRKNLQLLFFGDMMLDRHVGEKIEKYGLDYLFAKLDEERIFVDKNLISANLEGAVT